MARKRRRTGAGPRVIHRGGFGTPGATNRAFKSLVDQLRPSNSALARAPRLLERTSESSPYGIPSKGIPRRKKKRT